MDLKQLQYFKTIVEEGSISAAADKLFMSQPPLSSQMQLLEKELGCRLFNRGPRHIDVTPAGETLYNYACHLLSLSDQAKKATMKSNEQFSHTIKFGVVSSLASSNATLLVSNFIKEHSDAQFDLVESDTYNLLKKLNNGDIPVAFMRTPFTARGIDCTILTTEELVAVGTPEILPAESTITLKKLASLPLITYRRWKGPLDVEFSNRGLTPHYSCINGDARTTIALVESGIGVGIMPESALHAVPDSLLSRRIRGCTIRSDIVLAQNPGAMLSEYTKEFIELLRSKI